MFWFLHASVCLGMFLSLGSLVPFLIGAYEENCFFIKTAAFV